MTNENLIQTVLPFLEEIGIEVQFAELNDDCFLPGLSIENGRIIIDMQRLKYPGDILHEAAHIAVVPPEERSTLNAKSIAGRKDNAAEEMMAIAWSYAAAIHLHIDPKIVLHDEGYQGGGSSIADNFSEGKYFGVPMLQWTGMCADDQNAIKLGVNPYPHLLNWLRK
ncbi:MAG: hypothetical protein NTW29_10045 [Bacteroidetes bacterium]|nr:hypothetical protein [Bacteroidota bacterium]